MRKNSIWRAAIGLVAVLVLAACGGGGGGSSTATPVSGGGTPPTGGVPPPVISINGDDAIRLADQAAFGPSTSLVGTISAQGAAWIDSQIQTTATGYPVMLAVDSNPTVGCAGQPSTCFRDNYSAFPVQRAFFQNALNGPDQLRQRVALAYSQIFVTSAVQIRPSYAIREYQQMLLNDAFVNYRQLIEDVTLSPVMGDYLDMVNNHKANASGSVTPNENYAREVLQLFSIGTSQLNADGTLVTSGGEPVPAYTQDDVEGFASAFTGWTYPVAPGKTSTNNNPSYYLGKMIPVDSFHDVNAKQLLSGVTLAAGQSTTADLKGALDNIFNHPNVGPFIGKQLIQFLVTSNPSPAYVARVGAVFNNDGTGVRGNMGAVVKAILMDTEARGAAISSSNFGRLRDPAMDAISALRALNGKTDGQFMINAAASEGQSLFNADSVFSFYSPSYALPGSTTLVAPQFGIQNATSSLARLNYLNSLIYTSGGIKADTSLPGSTGTQIDLSPYQAVAGDSNALVNMINAQLMHHAMSAAEISAVVTAVNAIAATDTTGRASAALYLVLASPRYQIVR